MGFAHWSPSREVRNPRGFRAIYSPAMRRGLEAFHEDADAWRGAVGARAPVYDRLLAAAAAIFDQPAGSLEEAARARVEAAWRERRFSAGYDRPLLLMAALRAEAL